MVNGKLVLFLALVLMIGGPIFVKVAERSMPEHQAEKLDTSVIFGKSEIAGAKNEDDTQTTVMK